MNAAQALDVFSCPLDGTRLIEASAGTGKTWSICGIYLRLLLDARRPLPVQQVLVVSFTKAATAELRDRIRQRLVEVLAVLEGRAAVGGDPFVERLLASLRDQGQEDETLRRRLALALREFDEAAIFTIHGFCQRALDDAPFTAGLPLRQELMEDDSELREQAAADFWRRHIAGPALAPGLANCILQERDTPEKFARLLQRHSAKPLSKVRWPDAPDVVPPEFAALEQQYAVLRTLWLRERSVVLACVKASLPSLNGNSYSEDKVRSAGAAWDAAFAGGRLSALFNLAAHGHLLRISKYKPKKNAAPCKPHTFFEQAEELLVAWEAFRAATEHARMELLRKLVEEGTSQLRALKRERRVVAFDDMLFNLNERLKGERGVALAHALRERFPAALIDEFQDTDPLQFATFDTIYGGRDDLSLFLVGDPKQAIYSFRNADLHTYLRAKASAKSEYTLSENQRSSAPLIAALNALFGRNPRAFMLPGLDYREVVPGAKPRKPFIDGGGHPRSALQLWTLPPAPGGDTIMKAGAMDAAARACAAEIARLLAPAPDKTVLHDGVPLAAHDIAVLVRSHAEGSRMRTALAALGVGSVELAQTSVFESQDAEELEQLLRAVLEPARQGLVRAALATQLLGLEAAALDALGGDEAAMLERITRFSEYRALWLARGIGPMLRELMAREHIPERMLPRSDGDRRLTNLRHLAECLHEASREHTAPEPLLRWLQRQRRDASGGEATQVRLESDRKLVQIVTIHKSKGLEYPVVFCPFLWNGHPGGGPKDLPGREYHDDQDLPVIDYRDADDGIKKRIEAERDAERLRLIYVALTRAVHRCYLVVGSYMAKAGRSVSSKECTGNPLNWLVAGQHVASPSHWRGIEISGADIVEAWKKLAAENREAIGLAVLPTAAGVPLAPEALQPEAIAARPAPAAIPSGWRRGSYSGLVRGAKHETAAIDHDLRAARREASQAARAALASDDILKFPSGAREGVCLHAAFERADFADPQTWSDAAKAALRRHPPAGMGTAEPGLAAMVTGMLRDVLTTPLPAGLALSQVQGARRITELEFHLAAPHVSTAELTASMTRHGYPCHELPRQVLEGYLHGFIDLVFEHEGQFHIVDWKSNHLGYEARDYGPAQLQTAMDNAGYHLQYLLYTIAVHRWLQRRLPGYDYEQHFGGVHYLFVRGVRPQWGAAGVYARRPELALVRELEALFGRTEEEHQ